MKKTVNLQPHIREVAMGVFPTMDSVQEVIDMAESKLPITDKNSLQAILAIYHNTLLKAVKE